MTGLISDRLKSEVKTSRNAIQCIIDLEAEYLLETVHYVKDLRSKTNTHLQPVVKDAISCIGQLECLLLSCFKRLYSSLQIQSYKSMWALIKEWLIPK